MNPSGLKVESGVEIVSTQDLIRKSRLSRGQIYRLVERGIIEPIRVGTTFLWHLETVRAALIAASKPVPRSRKDRKKR